MAVSERQRPQLKFRSTPQKRDKKLLLLSDQRSATSGTPWPRLRGRDRVADDVQTQAEPNCLQQLRMGPAFARPCFLGGCKRPKETVSAMLRPVDWWQGSLSGSGGESVGVGREGDQVRVGIPWSVTSRGSSCRTMLGCTALVCVA